MRPLKLHTKTALLVSVITVTLLVATLVVISFRVATVIREEQREFARVQAYNLANDITQTQGLRDPAVIGRMATLLKNQQANITTVRYWERTAGYFQPVAQAEGSGPIEPIPEVTILALRGNSDSKSNIDLPSGSDASRVRVFAPVSEPERLSGTVEVVMRLEPVSAIAWRYAKNAFWLSALAIVLITLATYVLFRQLIYRPIERLLYAMDRARAGDLAVRVPVSQDDELGRLSHEFNDMIGQVREMSHEREARQTILRERIADATAELQQRNEQLAEANVKQWQATHRVSELERLAAAGQTAAQFAHEVGTPLNTISGHVQLLRGSLGEDTAAAKRIRTISEQIERIERIVRQMLDRTRYPSPELRPLDVNNSLRDTFDAMAPALEERGVELKFAAADSLPLIEGNHDRLQQVFINLVNNALDAMTDGGVLRVSTDARAGTVSESGQVVVEMADSGSGMTPEVLARIFDPLYTTKQRGSGTGLGLVVVKQVVSEHHAVLEVTSEPKMGTTFTLRFPVPTGTAISAQAAIEEEAAVR